MTKPSRAVSAVSALSVNDSFESPEWIESTAALERLVDEALDQPAYAIDTEFLRERTYFPKLALIQMAWPGRTALIDPFAVDLSPLRRLLNSPVLAVLHAAEQDLEVLDFACGAVPQQMFDTQIAAGFLGFSSPSLLTLAERILGIKLSKGDRLTDWTQRPLTAAQIRYAASDVLHLLEMCSLLTAELEKSGRQSWAAAECELLRTRPRGQAHGDRAWWRLKDGRVLRGKDRIVAQEVSRWRELRARLEDRPVRFVLPDLAVISIAQGKPKTYDELGRLRAVDSRYIKGSAADEILEAVRISADLPSSALVQPEPEDFDRRLRPALAMVSAWVSQLAHDVRIDPTLLATRSDLVQLLRGDTDCRLCVGWRNEMIGASVAALVAGNAALAFESTGTLKLESRSHQLLSPPAQAPTASWVLDAPDHRHEDEL